MYNRKSIAPEFIVIGVLGFLLIGWGIIEYYNPAHRKVQHTRGHWNDRSSWKPNSDYVQAYYADTDGHLIGSIEGKADVITVSALCEYGTYENGLKSEIGFYETQEDAQAAVEKLCYPILRDKLY